MVPIGSSVSLYGDFYLDGSQNASFGSYTIDGEGPMNFTLPNIATRASPQVWDQLLFQTSQYPHGQHHFHLDFFGTANSVPFALTSIIVQNSTLPVPVPSLTASSLAPHAATSTPSRFQNHKVTHPGTIIGVVTAAIILALLTILSLLIARRRRRRQLAHPFTQPRIFRNEHVKGLAEQQPREIEGGHRTFATAQASRTVHAHA